MKKIIRLTESDLTRIVKRILKEQPKGIENPNTFFKGWTKEEIDFYNKLPNKDDDYYNYTSQEVLDSIRTRMETAATLGAGKEKREQGLVQLGDEPGYASKPKTENAGEKGDQTWYNKFPCIPEESKKSGKYEFDGTPVLMFDFSRDSLVLYFYDGSQLFVQVMGSQTYTRPGYWYCRGNVLEASKTPKYNAWVPKSDPRSQAEKYEVPKSKRF